MSMDTSGTQAKANAYAQQSWCWDDTSMIDALVDRAVRIGVIFQSDDDAAEFVDEHAEHYDLTEPRELGP